MASSCILRKALALAFGLGLALTAFAGPVAAGDPAKADLTVDTSGGYARLVFTVSDDFDASARLSGNVLIIAFTNPIAVAVDRLAAQAPDYVAAARRDPDGKAVRIGLARKVKLNAIVAGQKYFVDLLPDTWSGAPPSLPQDVIEELARKAREAARLERLERQAAQPKVVAPVRVRVATQPTFTRFVFELPGQTSVTADRANDRLTLVFDTPIKFDFGDAAVERPPTVAAIKSEVEEASTLVRFSFADKVDVHSFRDDQTYVVDVDNSAAKAGAKPDAKNGDKSGDKSGAADSAMTRAATTLERAAESSASPAAPPEEPHVAPPATVAVTAPDVPAPEATAPPADMKTVPPSAPVAAPTLTPETKTATPAPEPAAVPPAAPATSKPEEKAAAPVAQTPGAPAVAPMPAMPAGRPSADSNIGGGKGAAGRPDDTIAVDLSRQGVNLKLSFPFLAPTAAAVFQRADTLWIVFDAKVDINLSALEGEATRTIRGAELTRAPDATIVRIRLDRPRIESVDTEGAVWAVTIGDAVLDPPRALELTRNIVGHNRSTVTVNLDKPQRLHRFADPEVGDQLFVVTALAPIRGFLNPQTFVEFRALGSAQGVAIEPLADDVEVALTSDKIVISRPSGLILSNSLQNVLRGSGLRATMFDSQLWGLDRGASYGERQASLLAAAAAAPAGKRTAQRLDLARFYLARDMYPEAKGVLDVMLADQRPANEEASAMVLRAIAELMMNRPEDTLRDLANPIVGDQHDAPLWRALAYAQQGKWALARQDFKSVEASIATLPIELQRQALMEEMRAAIEVGDFGGANDDLNDLETIGVPHEMRPAMSVLIGRLAEGTDHRDDALAAYRAAAESSDRPAAAEGRLHETLLRYALGDLKREEVVGELETLTTIWRGDDTEVEALHVLARLYTEAGRYRDSFYVMRTAMAAHPNSDLTRRIEDEAAATFETLFLGGKGDTMPAVDALALFYDFHELVPIGRRGDEMIRRLADRLVSVDLLDQAAELLQYQVDHRLQGAARAQVATRLAVIYLINHKPDLALATLRATRSADVATDMRQQHLLLEARALSDLRRHDLALEVIANVGGPAAVRLRADILWAARRWRQSAEQIELYYGDRYKEWQPLNADERTDILRAAIGYALDEDTLGLGRFREKYAAKMAQTPDARAFEIATSPLGIGGGEFREIAGAAASVDTLEGFLRDVQAHYPEAGVLPQRGAGGSAVPPPSSAAAAPTAAIPSADAPPGANAPPAGTPAAAAPSINAPPLTAPPQTSGRAGERSAGVVHPRGPRPQAVTRMTQVNMPHVKTNAPAAKGRGLLTTRLARTDAR
jgi:hypothetical protein